MDLKRDLAKRGIELESMNHQLVSEKEEKVRVIALTLLSTIQQ